MLRLWGLPLGAKSCLCPYNCCVTLRNVSASSSIKRGTQLEGLLRGSKEIMCVKPVPTLSGTQQGLSKCWLLLINEAGLWD